MRLGIAHHFGWAVAVTASADNIVVDRRRIESAELDELTTALPEPIASVSLRAWPGDFPDDFEAEAARILGKQANQVL